MSQQVNVYRELNLQDSAKITGRQVIAKTAAYTVTPDDAGKLLVGNHASTQVAFTLPAVASCKGLVFHFASLGAAGIKIIGGTTDKIVVQNDAAADSVSYETASEKIGAACMVWGDGSNYYFFEQSGCTVTVGT